MAKFYVQSGTLQAIVDSPDVDRAALWAIHRAMEQITPLDISTDVSPRDKAIASQISGLVVLGETIYLSEVGFNDPKANIIDTFDAFHEWYALARAIEKLERLL